MKHNKEYRWVMDRVETLSPFGHELVRRPTWYGPGREGELNAEFDRVELALALPKADELRHELSQFRDIRGTFRREGGAPMDVVELFQVKHFLLRLERLTEIYQNALPGVEPVPMEDMLSLLDPTGRRLAPFSVENAFDPALEGVRAQKESAESEEGRREAARREREIELQVRRRLTDALLREKERFFANMDALGRLDWVLAKAALVRKYGCARPEVGGGEVLAEDMLHPQVEQALREKGLPFTPVSVLLERGAAVVTGANMGGKSVFLQALVLNLLLLHTGYFVFAAYMRSPLFHAVEWIGADGQSAEGGLSSFGAEMKALDGVLREEKGKFFFLALDEFARGTNPAEGAALARSLVEHLNGLDCVAVLTTHYDGVSDAARRHYRVAGLEEGAKGTLEDLPLLMDYSLVLAEPGRPCPRDAHAVCRMLGLEEDFLSALLDS